jgi:hypothetical protein
VVDFPQRRRLVLHWPMLGAITAWLLIAVVPAFFYSEIIRAIVAIGCIGLMAYQWLTYRKTISGSNFMLLSLLVAGFTLASLWMTLNVVRFYTYDHVNDRMGAWHSLVIRIQTPLAWVVGLLVVIVSVWALLLLVSCLSRKVRTLTGRVSP